VATTGLADVGARDPQPLVLGWRRQHAAQQLAVAGLQLALLLQHDSYGRDPLGERVAHLLQLLEPGHPRLGEMTRHGGVDRDAGKRLRGETGELVLEAGDLASQLSAREALIASNPKRFEHVSIEQIRHKTESSVNHRPATEREKLVKRGDQRRSGLEGSAGDPERLVDRRLGHPLDLNGDKRDPARS
jgi:hypothetical protein